MIPNYQVTSILVGLFLRKLEIQDPQKLVEALPWRLPEFDGQPRAQKLPPNAPADVARIAFTSQDTRKVLELAPAKLQFRMVPGELVKMEDNRMNLKTSGFAEAFEQFIPQVMRIHSVFADHYGLVANRVGVLTEMIAPLGNGVSSNQRMHEHFFGGKNLFGDRLHELHVHALSKTTIMEEGRGINRWIRVRTLRSGDAGAKDVAIGVEVDVNTLPDDNYDLSGSDIEKFLTGVKDHLASEVPLFTDEALFKVS